VEVQLGGRSKRWTPTRFASMKRMVIPTRTLVWAAGVRPHPLVAALGSPRPRRARARRARLRVEGRPDVFVIGDASAEHATGACP